MKTLYILLLISFTSFGQNELTFGRHGADCRGSGICSFNVPSSKNQADANSIFIENEDGSITLRIFRDKLTTDDENKLMGTTITEANMRKLSFTMQAALPLPVEIQEILVATKLKNTQELEAKTYPTVIREDYIDITINE